MAARSLLLLVVVALVVAAQAQTNAPPNVQGQWYDAVCNLVPNSDQLYQNRTYFFSTVNTKTLDGTYELVQQYFGDSACGVSQEIYRTSEKGSFVMSTRASLERFWKINYFPSSRSMQVFTSNYATTVNQFIPCKFPSLFSVNVQQDISAVSCSELNLISVVECPVEYDIVRRDGTNLYVGQRFPGLPPVFHGPCLDLYRPTEFDQFSFTKQADATTAPVQPVLAPNPTNQGTVFVVGNAVGPLALISSSSNAITIIASSVVLASVVLVQMLLL